jgi:FKBP-type peptidyl-prolyl cis-trans isomerase
VPQSRPNRSQKVRSAYRPKVDPKNASKELSWILPAAIFLLAVVTFGVYFFYYRSSEPANASTTSTGLKYVDQVVGTGPSPRKGQRITVHYTGRLQNGIKFDSSVDRGTPYEFAIGTGSVIKGWDEGIMSMKVGGKRHLIVPPSLGYGAAGSPPAIPPNATLEFDVELLGLK